MPKSQLPHPITYKHCNSRLFHHESRDTCCTGGKVSFSRVNSPIDDSAEGKHFRQHIRSYNHVLSFTSIGVHVDENILASGRGIYTFRAQGRLRCIKEHQSDIRAELYQGLQDALHVGETNAENIGKRVILPSPFIGGRRDMTQHNEDGMTIVLNGDRPDLLTRIFRSKFEQLKDDVINKGVLGKVKSYMYVTEFQKGGLSHVHMLLVLESNDKLHDPKDYDSMVRAEIPKLECEPQLHKVVVKHMMYGPCSIINQKSPCMEDVHCKKRYPKQFLDETRQGTDSYPEYRRRFDESILLGRDRSVDNRWLVPYNHWLLLKYDCHINVEICSSIKSIKYLYKYVYRGPDRVAMEVHKGSYMDEVQQYVDARWICAPEELWKIFRFTLY
ncbi:hypothetical protein KIW84_033864 [Lathyrus oleraceus]|uniref:Helitron helicase-like domain-containing protein n=1 Tax=Pisum sativum TaxID=3888 RepID=A0A9D4Y2H8_PEA|nr:hypothetical protein KIW84_033864 [Pisum sativum]